MLTIGELAGRTGVAASALRYWDEIGLLPAPARVSGRRRYPPSAVQQVGVILLLRDVGFTLGEIKEFFSREDATWRDLYRRKIDELDRQITKARTARAALAHGLNCPHTHVTDCPHFTGGLAAYMAGASLAEAHERAHSS